MFPIEQSAFLHALGHAIGNSLWQMAAFWLVYTLASHLFVSKANHKYLLATAASLLGFICFVVSFINSYTHSAATVGGAVYYLPTQNQTNHVTLWGSVLYLYHSIEATLQSLSPYISCGYLMVFLLLSIRLVNGFKQVHHFSNNGLQKMDVQWRLFVQEHSGLLQIKKQVSVFASHLVQSPLTMGFLKPLILLPMASLNQLSTAQIEAIILHELAHISRNDYLINIFLRIAETSLFFNPFMRLLLKQIKQERENSCDDFVLQFKYSAKDYARALLAIEENNTPTLLALGAKGNQSFQLLNRVKRMVAPQPQSFSYKQQLYLLFILTIFGFGFTLVVPKHEAKPMVASITPSVTIKKDATKKANKTIGEYVPQPAAFNLVKTIEQINWEVENLDTEALEKQAEAIGKKAEKYGQQYAQEIERAVQPMIAKATAMADAFGSKQNKMESSLDFENKMEDWQIENHVKQLTNTDAYLQPILKKLNRVLQNVPFANMEGFQNLGEDLNTLKINPSIFKPLKGAPKKNELGLKIAQNINEKTAIENQRMVQTVAIEKAIEQKLATQQQQFHLKTLAFKNALKSYEIAAENRAARPKNPPVANLHSTPPTVSYSFTLPAIEPFTNLSKTYLFNWNNNLQVNPNNNAILIDNVDENEEENLPQPNKQNKSRVNIHKEKRLKNGKEENILIIEISSSK